MILVCLIHSWFLSPSHHRRHQAHYHPRRPPHCHLPQRALRAALPGREGDAVAAGGAAESAGREEDRRYVDAAHPQGSACPHGPLHLPGGELQWESLHLHLRERYTDETVSVQPVYMCLRLCGVCEWETAETELKSRASRVELRKCFAFYCCRDREHCVWVCLQKKVFVTLPIPGTVDTGAIYWVHDWVLLYFLLDVTPHPLGPLPSLQACIMSWSQSTHRHLRQQVLTTL